MAGTEINTVSYMAIADDYATAASGIEGISANYYNAAYEIVILSSFDPNLDLLSPFYNAYLASASVYENIPVAAISAVGELQRHILSKARDNVNNAQFTSIDAWMAERAVTVPQEFADISNLAGYTISSTYIS